MEALKVIISAPSGGGKTTLIKRLLSEVPGGVLSVSHTTRPPRPGEKDGKDYHFVSKERFLEMVKKNEFAEWAYVHDHMYGTSKKEVEKLCKSNRYVVFEIDVQGAANLRKEYPDAIDCFVLPPSMKTLRKRLINRGTEDEKELQIRLNNAKKEIKEAFKYKYVIVNDDLDRATKDLICLVKTGLNQTERFKNRIKELLEEE